MRVFLKVDNLALLLFSTFCFVALIWSTRFFLSELFLIKTELTKKSIEIEKDNYDRKKIDKTLEKVDLSIFINPNNEKSHIIKAQLLEYIFENEKSNSKYNAQKKYNLALESYKKALELRPHWGYAWAKLSGLYKKSPKKQFFMSQIQKSLLLAIFLSPYEKNTQSIVIPLLFEHKDIFFKNKILALQAKLVIKHALKNYSNNKLVFESAKKYKKLDFLQSIVTLDRNIKHLKEIKTLNSEN